jgi:hypothetical protein
MTCRAKAKAKAKEGVVPSPVVLLPGRYLQSRTPLPPAALHCRATCLNCSYNLCRYLSGHLQGTHVCQVCIDLSWDNPDSAWLPKAPARARAQRPPSQWSCIFVSLLAGLCISTIMSGHIGPIAQLPPIALPARRPVRSPSPALARLPARSTISNLEPLQ